MNSSNVNNRAQVLVRELGLYSAAVLMHGSTTWAVYYSPTCDKVVEVRSVNYEPTSVYMADKAAVRRRWSNRIRNGAQVLNL